MPPPKKLTPSSARQPATERKQRGRVDGSVMFPVASSAGDMPADYAQWVAEIKGRIHGERLRLVLSSNSVMVLLYWDIGQRILHKQVEQGYGTKVIDRLAADLRQAFPDMKGFSPRNLKYMRAFASAWSDQELVQRTVAQLSWGQNIVLLEKLTHDDDRLWYAARIRHGGTRLQRHVPVRLSGHRRPAPRAATGSDAPHMPLVLPLQNGCLGKSANAA